MNGGHRNRHLGRHLCFIIFVVALVLLFLAVELLFPTHAYAESPPSKTMWVVVGEDSELNMRFKPTRDSSREGSLYHGQAVEVYEIRKGWATINYCGDILYCSADYLSSEPPMEPASYYIVSSGRVRIRTSPNGKLVKWARPNEKLTVTGWQEVDDVRWAVTTKGYIMAEYLAPCYE